MTQIEDEIWRLYPEKTCDEIAEELGEPIEFVIATIKGYEASILGGTRL